MTSAEISIAGERGGADRRAPAVLQVLPALGAGGAERGAVDIAAALVESGWKAVVASSGGGLVRELERAGVRHVELPLASKNPLTILANARALEAIIVAERIDIVHARSRAPGWSAYLAARRRKRFFVTTFHGAYDASNWLKRRYNGVMARGDRIIAISRFIADHAIDTYGIGRNRVDVIERGIDLERFNPDRVTPARMVQLAHAWRLPDGMPVIMLPGRLARLKGQSVLIDAVARLDRRDLRCLFIGEGHRGVRRRLESRIAALGIGDICRFVDHCSDMPAAYMLADVVVSASTRPEGFGRIIAEGLAMGRPVIATDHGGAREILTSGEAGWLVPPGDPIALAEALDEALALGPLQRIVRANDAIDSIRARFDKRRMAQQTIELYERLLFPEPRADASTT